MKDAGSIVSVDAGVSLEEQARGLDWVHWLLRGVRQQSAGVILARPETSAGAKARMHTCWRAFVRDRIESGLGGVLLQAWEASAARDVEALLNLESDWINLLVDSEEKERSQLAGQLLLRRTSGARYQGALGHYRQCVEEGRGVGHIGIVWPAIAHLFQLPPVTMLSEYLRLEWETAVRDLHGIAAPVGSAAIAKTATRVLQAFNAPPARAWRKLG